VKHGSVLVASTVLLVVAVSVVTVVVASRRARHSATPPARTTAAHTPSATVSTTASTPAARASSWHHAASSPSGRPAAPGVDAAVRALAAQLPAGGVSVAAVNTATGARYTWGATGGMRTGSIAKVLILETLLLHHQDAGTDVTEDEDETATRMIENSANDAADTLYFAIGGRDTLVATVGRLGLKNTIPGPDPDWGFTQTSGSDALILLHNLISTGPLNAYSRGYALNLMHHVEADQRWGVGAVADPGTAFAIKDGWLPVENGNPGGVGDDGRWLVNSVGIVTVHGQQLLMAVFTQHGSDFEDGVELVESLAKAITPAVVAK
jgi:hypothetical protein